MLSACPAVTYGRGRLFFQRVVSGRYRLRGVEVIVTGQVVRDRDETFLLDQSSAPPLRIRLMPVHLGDNVRLDPASSTHRSPEPDELTAYADLTAEAAAGSDRTVTGPLRVLGTGYELAVRVFR